MITSIRPMPVQQSVSLVTCSTAGIRDSGTGFTVGFDASAALVVTCRHVIRNWEPETIQVNGRKATLLWDGAASGVDLALLRVLELNDAPKLELKEFVTPNASVYGYGFNNLHGEHYVRRRIAAKVSRLLSFQGKDAQRSVPAWEIRAEDGYSVLPGNSGAPLLDAKTHRVAGVLAFRADDGKTGIAISPYAVQGYWPGFSAPVEVDARLVGSDRPPQLPDPLDPDDPQRGRFGGKAKSRGLQLSARLTVKERSNFYFDVSVSTVDGLPIEGPARFFLHTPTYPRSIIWVSKPEPPNSLELRDVYSYGVYTVGCQVRAKDGTWVNLEYDLSRLRGLPAHFKAR